MAFKEFFKSNFSYFIQKESDIQWITVRGAHIPIKPGQSKDEAIKEHIGGGDKKTKPHNIKPEHIAKLHKVAAVAKAEIDALAHQIADRYGITVMEAPLKSPESIIRKAVADYGGDISKVTDVARNTIVTGNKHIDHIISDFKKHGSFVKYKEHKAEEQHGYTGHLIKTKAKNGHVSEIQVNTPEMIYGKEPEKDAREFLGDALYDKIKEKTGMEGGMGHKHYEVIRDTNSTDEEIADASKQSHAYYDAIREKTKGLQFK
jgi:hypothetical protein